MSETLRLRKGEHHLAPMHVSFHVQLHRHKLSACGLTDSKLLNKLSFLAHLRAQPLRMHWNDRPFWHNFCCFLFYFCRWLGRLKHLRSLHLNFLTSCVVKSQSPSGSRILNAVGADVNINNLTNGTLINNYYRYNGPFYHHFCTKTDSVNLLPQNTIDIQNRLLFLAQRMVTFKLMMSQVVARGRALGARICAPASQRLNSNYWIRLS